MQNVYVKAACGVLEPGWQLLSILLKNMQMVSCSVLPIIHLFKIVFWDSRPELILTLYWYSYDDGNSIENATVLLIIR